MLCAAHRVASPSGERMRIFRSLFVRHICANSPLYRSLSFSLCSLWLYNCKRCILRITFPSRLRVLPWEGLDFPSTDSTLLVTSRLNFTQILSCSLHSLSFSLLSILSLIISYEPNFILCKSWLKVPSIWQNKVILSVKLYSAQFPQREVWPSIWKDKTVLPARVLVNIDLSNVISFS